MDRGNTTVSPGRSGSSVDKITTQSEVPSGIRPSHMLDAAQPIHEMQYHPAGNQRDVAIDGDDGGWLDQADSPKMSCHAQLSSPAASAELSPTTSDCRHETHIEPFELLHGLLSDGSDLEKCRRQLADTCHVSADSIEYVYPCTPLQEGIFALSQMADGARTYTQQFILRPNSHVQLSSFMMAWRDVVQKCAILRTRIAPLEGVGLVQVVIQEEMQWKIVPDLELYLEQDKAQAMGLGEPLARNGLVMFDDAEWTFVLTMNHAVYDGTSIQMVQQFLDHHLDNTVQLETPGNFSPFVKHICEIIKSDASRAYWTHALSDYEATPFPCSSAPTSTTSGSRDMTVIEKIFPTPQAVDVGLGTLIRAAWALLVHSNTGDSDVCFGMTFSGRSAPYAGDVSGPTIATVPMRIHMCPSDSVSDYLRSVWDQRASMFEHEQMGLRNIARLSSSAASATEFQTLLVIQPPKEEGNTAGTWTETTGTKDFATAYALNLECQLSTAGEMIWRAIFDCTVIEDWRMGKLLRQLGFLIHELAGVAAGGGETRLRDVEAIPPEDLDQIWSLNAVVDPPVATCVHETIRERAAEAPDSQAIMSWDGEMTFQQLDETSDQLAWHLVSLGVGARTKLVPLLFEKSKAVVVAMLAVMKTGAAFVPLDPKAAASQRRLRIFDQIEAQIILTSEQYYSIIDLGTDSRKAVCVGTEGLVRDVTDNAKVLLPKVNPEQPSYVIFTSGSTGTPKGVVIQHNAISTSAYSHGTRLGLSSFSRVLQFCSLCFDASILEILTTLTFGGCVAMPSEVALLENINSSIVDLGANTVSITPSMARLINPDAVPSMSTVLLAGESPTADDFSRWANSKVSRTPVKVHHGYGPTECSVLCTINSGDAPHYSIGTAVGCVSWIVDEENHLLPFGAVGELLIEGNILAQGYLGDENKTAEAFIEDPAWLLRGTAGRAGRRGRMYKTGDLVRYCDAQGRLAYVGRKDSQVKIRGNRIELREVEHQVLHSLSEPCSVVTEVIYPSGDKSSPMIAAFVAQKDDQAVESRTVVDVAVLPIDAAVEEAMAEKIPSYMIPTVFFAVNSIPLNTSGKTDRRKLRDLGSSYSLEKLAEVRGKGASKRKPKTVAECTLHEIWAAVLGMSADAIGLDDNFFKIGGDSLSAMSLVGMARTKTGSSSLSMAQIFQNPKLVDQARLLGLEAQQPELADVEPFVLIQDNVGVQACQEEVAEACGVLPEKVLDVYPCTPLQEGFVSLSLKKQGDYVLRRVMEIGASVDLNRLARAWERLVRSYPMLRTRVVQHSELGLVQVVLDESLQWTSAENLEEYLEQDKSAVVALGQPLARYCLVTDPRTRQRWLVWTIHHALYDGWTMPMMLEQVESFYHNITATPSCAPNFSNFVGHLLKTSESASDEFWRSRLQGYDGEGAFPVLPASVTEPKADSRTEISFTLPQQTPGSGLTLASIVRTAWAIVAHRQTGKMDICFGNVVSGRSASGVRNIETLLGPTVATIPFRVQVSPEQNPLSLAQMVQDISVEAMHFEQTGLQNIAKVSVDAQSACEGFQTLLVIQPPDSNDSVPSLGCWQDVSHIKDFATYALTVICHVSTDGGESKIEVVYDSRVLDAWSMQNIVEQLIHQINELVIADEDVSFSIGDMPSLTPDHAATIWEWNETVAEPVDQLIYEIIAQRTRERPESPAVCSWDGTLNYRELDMLSTIVARQLVALNVGPGSLVPLFFEKSMYAIVAIVGVLKAGAAYVPIDPSQAQDRRQLILEKAQAKVVLTSEVHSKLVLDHERSFVESIVVVGPSTLTDEDMDADLTVRAQLDPSKPAYVIFTSGSTGAPKGVVLTHRSVASSCTYHGAMIGLHQGSRVLQFSSYAFDASVFEILTTLIHGGCVCTPSTEDRYEDISRTIVSMSVNTAFFTPSVARLLDPERVPSLDTILLGGEASSESDLWRWEHCKNIMNLYGPTECSIICSGAKITPHVTPIRNIGPTTGCNAWIVDPDDHDRLAPLGCPGELLIEGPILADGYLNDEIKTLNAFIDSPVWLLRGNAASGQAGRRGRVYKTGDIARYNSDGSLIYIERKDTQVKIRGQRVELGEVERHVSECFPKARHVVAEVLAISGNDSSGNKTTTQVLAAFVSMEDDENGQDIVTVLPAPKHVTQHLKRCLPNYMIPGCFFAMDDKRVLSASGKIDRKALIKLAAGFTMSELVDLGRATGALEGGDQRAEARPPSGETEMKLRDLWAKTLNISPSTIRSSEDSFLQLGGDSVAAIKLVSECRRAGITLSVAHIFESPVLSDQARLICSSDGKELGLSALAPFSLLPLGINSSEKQTRLEEIAGLCNTIVDEIEDAYPCTPLQEGLLSLTVKDSRDYVLQRVLSLSSGIDVTRFQKAWDNVVASTPILRTCIVKHPDLGFLQVIIQQGFWEPFGVSLDDYLEQDRGKPMGVGGPLARYAMTRTATGDSCFALTLHHAAYDGWSLPLIEGALLRAYDEDHQNGDAVSEGSGFNYFVKYTLETDKTTTAKFWESELSGYEASSFPPEPSSIQSRNDYVRIEKTYEMPDVITPEITQSTVLRAAWALSVFRFTKERDVVYGSTVGGRNAPVPGIESMAGPTIATVPVRVRVSEKTRISEFLQTVQSQAVGTMPHEQAGIQNISKISEGAKLACEFKTLLVVQPSVKESENTSLGVWNEVSDAAAFASYPLTLIAQLTDTGSITLHVAYDQCVLDGWRLGQILHHFEMAMTQLSAPPACSQTLGDLESLSAVDRELLSSWSRRPPEPVEKCVHDTISERAGHRLHRQSTAVHAWNGQLSYGELDQLSTNLASQLIKQQNIQLGTVIPLYFEKSKWVLVAILGIMKAGCVFVMLDPTQAADRRRYILDQLGGTAALSSDLYYGLASEERPMVIRVGPSCESVTCGAIVSLPEPNLNSTAYILYTSGSTGTPKGTIVSHQALSSSAYYHGLRIGMGQDSRVLQFASYTFDACILELLTSLRFGGCVCIPHDDRRLDMASSIESFSANTAFFTPTVSRLINPQTVPSLRTIILGGEAVSGEDFQRWTHLDRVMNGYGPTETVVFSVMGNYESSSYTLGFIGKPVGCVCYVVDPDDHEKLMPVGAPGELLIQGPIVASGYLKNEQLNEASFIQAPSWLTDGVLLDSYAKSNERCYKTGDIVQYRSDGSLSYLGRKDTQTKIRGQRVELGEVEYHLSKALPEADSVFAEVGKRDGTAILAAFLVLHTDDTVSNGVSDNLGMEVIPIDSRVETELSEVLPGYMIPSIFFRIKRLPLNTAGKTDRRRLRGLVSSLPTQEMVQVQQEVQNHKRQPSTSPELALQKIWAQVLNLSTQSIGLDDSFLRIGGDSILAVHVSAAARSQRLDISAANILRNKTISRILQHCAFTPAANFVEPVLEDVAGQTFPLSPMQQLFFFLQDDPTVAFDQAVFLGLRKSISFESLKGALTGLIQSHAILRARFQQNSTGNWEQSILGKEEASASVRVSHECTQGDAETDVAAIMRREREALDPEHGPLVAAVLLEAGDAPQRLFVTIHHLVVDIISWHMIVQDLENLLTQRLSAVSSSLPFPIWSLLQENYARTQFGSAEVPHIPAPLRDYWGAEDFQVLEKETISQEIVLDKRSTSSLLGNSCNDVYQTRPVELLLAALFDSFSRTFPDRPLPTVFNEGHGRQPWDDSIDISRTVGWFTTMSPVFLGNSASSARDVFAAVRETKDVIRSQPQNGWTQFISWFANEDRAETFMAHYPVEILFNFNGVSKQNDQVDSLFDNIPLPESCAPQNGHNMNRFALFDVVATAIGDVLAIKLIFDRRFKRQDRIAAWMANLEATLVELATCLPLKEPEWTLCDFPQAFRSYEDIEYFKNSVMSQLGMQSVSEVEDIFPCSPVQEGILIAQLVKNTDYYRFSLQLEATARPGCTLSCSEMERKLTDAWRSVVRRHAILRTIFVDNFPGSKGTMQIVLHDPLPRIDVVDKDKTPDSTWGYEKDTLQHHLQVRRLSDRHFGLTISINHTIVDGHSMGILLSDFLTAYKGDGVALPESTSYKAFVQCVEKRSLEEGVDYWTKYLAGVEPCFFPVSNEGGETPKKRTLIRVEGLDTPTIRAFCNKWEFTPAAVIQAAWSLVLGRYSRCPVPCFGVLSSGRDTPVDGISDIFGPTLGMLTCRVDINGGRTVLDTLRQIQHDYTSGLPHQHVPLAAIHGALKLGPSSLFNSAMSFQRSFEPSDGPSSEISLTVKEGEDPTEYDAAVRVVDGKEITIVVECRGQPNELQAKQIGSSFSSAIASITTNWEGNFKDVDLLGDAERQRIWSWNASVPAAVEKTVHEVFHDCAQQNPQSIALSSWDGELTFSQLDRLSTSLALRLIDLGVGAEIMVPTFFEKSMWTVVSYLAVLKAGGAFVPLDPAGAPDRRGRVLQQTRARVVVTSEKHSRLPLGDGIAVVSVGPSTLSLHDPAEASLSELPQVQPGWPSYCIFTSGSTGEPKGVMHTHRSACSGMFHHGTRMGFNNSTRSFQFSNYTFDASIAEILTTLFWGGCVCVPSEADRLERLSSIMTEMRATLTIMTPSVARLIDPKETPTLKTIVLGGEASSEDDFRRWSHIKAIDGFGPSEAVVFSVVNVIDFSKPISGSIGRAVGSVSWVVDPDDADILVPIGAVGELLTEGPILAREYVHDEVKTAEAFIEDPPWLLQGNPAGGQPGRKGRLYKTRDLVKYAEDGTLTYLGRKDTQVKIRGHRIELGEVEVTLNESLTGVKHAVAEVVRLAGDETNPILAAFVVFHDEPKQIDSSLHLVDGIAIQPVTLGHEEESKLGRRLPAYMIPSLFLRMDELPLNTSGKVERKKLRALAGTFTLQHLNSLRHVSTSKRRLPVTKTEVALRDLWSRLLKLELSAIGLDDHFFQLGGDSITAMNLVAEARRSGLMLSVAQVFQSPRLVDLAMHISESRVRTQDMIEPFDLIKDNPSFHSKDSVAELAKLCDVDIVDIEDAYPCTPLQEGLLSLTLKVPGDYVLQSVMELPPGTDMDRFRYAWEQTAQEAAILRTRLVSSSWGLLQVVCKGSILWKTPSISLEEYLKLDKLKPVGLGIPLTRYGVVQDSCSSDTSYFVWSIHHALYDGGSIPLIHDMFRRYYEGLQVEKHPGFNSFVQHVAGQDQTLQQKYWAEAFAGYSSLPFPTVRPGLDKITATSTAREHFDLPRSGGRVDTTPANIFRAAWSLVSCRHARSHDAVFGVTVSGRSAPISGVERIIGPTIATVPVRVSVVNNDKPITVDDFLQLVQSEASAMIPFEQTGLQNIETASSEAREACQFQTLLVIQQLSGNEAEATETAFGTWLQKDQTQEFTTYALTLTYTIAPGRTSATVEASYDPRVIDDWTMNSMLCQITYVVQQLSSGTSGEAQITSLGIGPPQELSQIWSWNGHVPDMSDRFVHDVICGRALRYPDAPAIKAWDGELCYRELDHLTTQLASHLVNSNGVRAGDIIPICFEKSMWAPVSALAVLKAGGTVVYLDRNQPLGRLRSIVKRIGANLMLASPSVDRQLAELVENLVTVGPDCPAFGSEVGSALSTGATGDTARTLYIIFTSGTTGVPKAVTVSHRAFASSVKHQAARMNYTSSARVYDFASYGFDVAFNTTFMTLSVGGCICIPSESDRKDNLSGSINALGANLIDLTPSVLRLLRPDQVPGVKTIMLGGEALQSADIKPWSSSGVRIINGYGPAECTPQSTVNDATGFSDDLLSIGTGAGAVTWVVDPEDPSMLTPLGGIGELLLEGPLVTDGGYLNDPVRTAATFVEDLPWLLRGHPEGGFPGRRGRLYKTGDLVQYSPDGRLAFISRKDTQVKLRGQRVELGEVEYHVEKCLSPSVAGHQVIVETVQLEGATSVELAAFVVANSEATGENQRSATNDMAIVLASSLADIEQLTRNLATFMVPTIFFTIRQLPLTVSGKADRRQLRSMASTFSIGELASLKGQSQKRPPSTVSELELQDLWSRVLGIDKSHIGADDSFFHLGGNSIAAMRLAGLARDSNTALSVAQVFKTPKLCDLAEALEQDQAANRAKNVHEIEPFALLKKTLASSIDDYRQYVAGMCGVGIAAIQDIYPATPLQQGLFSLSLQRAGDFMLQRVMELPEHVDIDRMREAWLLVTRQVPVLRTRIAEHGSDIYQVIVDARDDSSFAWTRSASSLEQYLQEDRSIPMSFYRPLTRLAVVGDRHLVWTIHHAIYDAWSLPIMEKLAQDAYTGASIQSPPPFSAFIGYHLSIAPSDSGSFWKLSLQGFQSDIFPPLPPGTTQPPKANSQLDFASQLPRTARTDITSASLVKAAWALTVHHHTDTDDVVFGATVSGRSAPLAGIMDMVGPTIATAPVRVQIDQNGSVGSLLGQVQSRATDMIPFEQAGLQNISRLDEYTRHASTFQTLLVVQHIDEAAKSNDGLESSLGAWRDVAQASQFTTHALTLLCHHEPATGGIALTAMFDPDVLEERRMRRLLEHFGFVLEQLSSVGERTTVGQLQVNSARAMGELWKRNATVPPPIDRCIHEVIREHVLNRPDAPAICSKERDLTFSELDTLSTNLAWRLIDLNVTPETMVPLCFEKSVWAIVAMLGALKAGASFVPVDPAQSQERREHIFKQVHARVVLASEKYANLSIGSKRHIETVGPLSSALQVQPSIEVTEDLPDGSPQRPCYVLFTSGSTGTPKGCVVTHRAISSSAFYHGSAAGMSHRSRVIQFSRYTFDASIVEILTCLSFGGCVCVPSEYDLPDQLGKAIDDMTANTCFLTPSVARQIDPHAVPSLHTVLLAGEAPSEEDFSRWMGHAPPERRVLHGYGPTEASVLCSINGGPMDRIHASIGSGTGCVCWVTKPDDHSTLATVGAVGELVIEGPILADGYLGDSGRTADAFIRDPPWLLDIGRGGVVYKTGDLVRCNEDGTLTYVSRKDTQVKLRGQRIELGEIEYQMARSIYQVARSMKNVSDVVVEVIHPGGNTTNAALAAFFVAPDTSRGNDDVLVDGIGATLVSLDHLEDRLSRHIPEYMIPRIYLAVDSLPLNPSGKTDRKLLRELGSALTMQQLADLRDTDEAREDKRLPTTEAECALQQIWARVLNIEPCTIGLDDSFFNLGGDSITAMQVSSAARSAGLQISTANIVKNKTISLILQHHQVVVTPSSTNNPTEEEDENVPFPLSPIQQLFFRMQPDPTDVCFDQHLLLRLHKRVTYPSLVSAVETLVSTHSTLRARFRQDTATGSWGQYISSEAKQSVRLLHQHPSSSGEMSVAIQEIRAGMDIVKGPLVAAVLFEEPSGSQSLFLDIHHLVVDIVSWRVLLSDLEDLLVTGGAVPATTPTLPFYKWTALQRDHAQDTLQSVQPVAVRPPQLSYWGVEGRDIYERGAVSETFTLDAPTSAALLASDQHHILASKPIEVMIAYVLQSFRCIFPDRSLPTVFNESHGRDTWDDGVDVSHTVGWFTSMSPITISSQPSKTPDWTPLGMIRATQDCMRDLGRHGNSSYLASQFIDDESAQAFSSNFPAEILFNYGGSYQQLERSDSLFENLSLPEGCSPPESLGRLRRYALFEFVVSVVRGQVAVTIIYNQDIQRREEVAQWVAEYQRLLGTVAETSSSIKGH